MSAFAKLRDATADDVKAVAGYLAAAEQNIRDGDIGALSTMLDKWGTWGQMLLVRHDARMDEYNDARSAEASPHPPVEGGENG